MLRNHLVVGVVNFSDQLLDHPRAEHYYGTCAPGGSHTQQPDGTIITSVEVERPDVQHSSWEITSGDGINHQRVAEYGAVLQGAINFNGNSTSVRFDHNHITDTTQGDHTLNRTPSLVLSTTISSILRTKRTYFLFNLRSTALMENLTLLGRTRKTSDRVSSYSLRTTFSRMELLYSIAILAGE